MKTHCKNGHERTPENLNANRACKVCCRARDEARYSTRAWRLTAHCKRGHEMTPENIMHYGNRGVQRRRCKRCFLDHCRRYYRVKAGIMSDAHCAERVLANTVARVAKFRESRNSKPAKATVALWDRWQAQKGNRKKSTHCSNGHPRTFDTTLLADVLQDGRRIVTARCRLCLSAKSAAAHKRAYGIPDIFAFLQTPEVPTHPKEIERQRIEEALKKHRVTKTGERT
jgi:hypothetical protein